MKKPVQINIDDDMLGLYKPKGVRMPKTKTIVGISCSLVAAVAIALACCAGCDNKETQKNIDTNELADVQEQLNKLISLNEGLAQENKSLSDSLVFYKDSLKNVSNRLTECEKGKRCPVKKKPVKAPAKKPVKKPAPVVVKPDTVKPAPVVVKPDTIKPAPVVVKPDTVAVKPQVVLQDNANHNVVNINNGTVNNYYGPTADTTKCRVIIRAKITQTIKTR